MMGLGGSQLKLKELPSLMCMKLLELGSVLTSCHVNQHLASMLVTSNAIAHMGIQYTNPAGTFLEDWAFASAWHYDPK